MSQVYKLIREARDESESYWMEAAKAVSWYRPPGIILNDDRRPFTRWFEDGETNTCYNAVDRHVEAGHGSRSALIFESAMTGRSEVYTFSQLQDHVARTARILADLGVVKGDRVVIYMPMVPEAIFAMLASVRLGAIHSVVFGGFAAKELAKRIDDAKPKVVMSASCGLEPGRIVAYKPLLDSALVLARHKPECCLILQREQAIASLLEGRDLDWERCFARAKPMECVPVESTHPSYILYTSGTTGVPKGVVRDTGGHMVALIQSMRQVYNVQPGNVFWTASDIGWVVGHSYIVYAPLLVGATTIMFEGKPVGTPDAGSFWRLIDKHKVDVLFTAPTAFRAIKGQDPNGVFLKKSDLSSLKALFLAGERADPDTIIWAKEKLNVQVIDHWWQTELGWPALATCLGLGDSRTLAGSAGRPVPGFDICVVDDDHQEVEVCKTGSIVIRLPLPPGTFPTLWQNEEGYRKSYFEAHPGFYNTGDAGFIDEEGFVHVMSRTDDLINVAGHRLSTGGIEQVIAEHPDVAECAVLGVHDVLKGQIPVGLLVLNTGVKHPHEKIVSEVITRVREKIGPVVSFKHAAVVTLLPKTRSGKILRGTLRKIADGDEYVAPATIDDPNALVVAKEALAKLGFPE